MGNVIVEGLSALMTKSKKIKDDIFLLDFCVVNAYLIGDENNYLLIDTGLNNSRHYIKKIIRKYYSNRIPKAIILTHGHFDHLGSVKYFSEKWKIPIYAHQDEIPYLIGEKDYPEGNPHASSGLVAKLSPSFPHTAIDLKINKLPQDFKVPYLEDWRWIHSPGHTEGHIALFREKDRTLISGDAIITTKQEYLSSVIFRKEEISGPPQYFTFDWERAKDSIYRLQQLHPFTLLPSHGKPLSGERLQKHLHLLLGKIT